MTIVTINGEHMPVTEKGFITRKCMDYKASGQWRLLGAARLNNFGKQVDFVPFPQCLEIKDWQHKNGKQRWFIMDLDHGSRRMWTHNHKII